MNYLITQRHSQNEYGDWIDSLENNYINFFQQFDINLIPVSNSSDKLENFLSEVNFEGIIFTGGGNINPDSPQKKNIPSRENIESFLLGYSIKNKKPVLGICRGMQFINLYFNGKLVSDIPKIDKNKNHNCPGEHKIEIVDEQLKTFLNNGKYFSTNSYHNQGILKNELGNNLISFAEYKELNLVEGLYHKFFPIAGMIWHPERKNSVIEVDKILVESFLNKKLYWEKN